MRCDRARFFAAWLLEVPLAYMLTEESLHIPGPQECHSNHWPAPFAGTEWRHGDSEIVDCLPYGRAGPCTCCTKLAFNDPFIGAVFGKCGLQPFRFRPSPHSGAEISSLHTAKRCYNLRSHSLYAVYFRI